MGSKLRKQFEDHMTLRGFAPKTKEAYVSALASLAVYYRLSPDGLTNAQIQSYLVHLIRERKLSWSSCNVAISAFRCFYGNLLKRDSSQFEIPPRPRIHRLPRLLSEKEVRRIIKVTENPKHHAMLMTVYGAGLRVSEVVRLKPVHIESDRKLIRVEQGKGRKDRYTILPDRLLVELRSYWKECQPGPWLFFGERRDVPMSDRTAQKVYNHAREKAGVTGGSGIHTLRHCFATHLLDRGTSINVIKQLLGHTNLGTTVGYLHTTLESLQKIRSPLDDLY